MITSFCFQEEIFHPVKIKVWQREHKVTKLLLALSWCLLNFLFSSNKLPSQESLRQGATWLFYINFFLEASITAIIFLSLSSGACVEVSSSTFQEIAASFSGGGVRGYENGPAFVPGEICRIFRSAGEKFLNLVWIKDFCSRYYFHLG